jgi:hypothetical protein
MAKRMLTGEAMFSLKYFGRRLGIVSPSNKSRNQNLGKSVSIKTRAIKVDLTSQTR